MGLVQEFREFAVKGNAIDMAVGIVIGAAFTQVVNSLVNDVIMPPLGMLVANVDFSDLAITLRQATDTQPAVTIGYGVLLNTILNFLIVAFAIFLVVRQINRLKRQPAAVEPTSRPCPYCASAIPKVATRCPFCTSQLE